MKQHRRKIIEESAQGLLEKHHLTAAPVNVEALARAIGILIRRTATENDISGFLFRHPGVQPIIGVNTSHHPNRQRFSIAHEIGHLCLGHEQDQVHVSRDQVTVFRRDQTSSSGEDPNEVEANRFAAALLMPAELLQADLEGITLSNLLDDHHLKQLAKRYQVSVQAMTNRLVTLGYLSRSSLGGD